MSFFIFSVKLCSSPVVCLGHSVVNFSSLLLDLICFGSALTDLERIQLNVALEMA